MDALTSIGQLIIIPLLSLVIQVTMDRVGFSKHFTRDKSVNTHDVKEIFYHRQISQALLT